MENPPQGNRIIPAYLRQEAGLRVNNMDAHKIQNFKKEYPNKEFPQYKTLSKMERHRLCASLIEKVSERDDDVSDKTLVSVINSAGQSLEGINVAREAVNINEIFQSLKITPNQEVFLNWYQFNEVDTIDYESLIAYFYDLWYPSSDDLDVFDSTLSWIVSFDHEGYVKFIKF